MVPFLAGKGVFGQGGMGGDCGFPTVTALPGTALVSCFSSSLDFHAHCCYPCPVPCPTQFLGLGEQGH